MANGTLGGTVMNVRTSQGVDNATVDAKSADGQDTKATTGPDGSFGMDLAEGVYDVTVTANGFDPGDYPGIYVFENQPTYLKFALWPNEY